MLTIFSKYSYNGEKNIGSVEMMSHVYCFTGFPGFISNQLIREIIKEDAEVAKIIAIVLPSQIGKAQLEKEAILKDTAWKQDQFILMEGDITKPNLNLNNIEGAFFSDEVTHFFHLAAIYDLAVPKDLAYLVNVVGTRHVNEFVLTLPNIKRYTYFSTAYVAGKREGILYENELLKPDAFKNYYEETKYEAEVLVDSLKDKVPVTIIRPGIVKGHTNTGETIKFDGPYFMLNFLNKLRHLPIIPYISKSSCVINLVPVDYIIRATVYLSLSPIGKGKTYHLTDPKPYTVTEIYEMFMENYNRKKPIGILPFSITKWSLSLKPIRKFLGVEVEALDYFTWKGTFDCTNAQKDLEGSTIGCPDFKDGVVPMVEYYRRNKDKREYHINIT